MRPPKSPRDQPASAIGEKTKTGIYWAAALVFAGALAVAVAKNLAPADIGWPETLLLAAALAGTIAALARQLPFFNALSAAIVVALAGGGVSALDARTGVPFGAVIFGEKAGAKLFNLLPWAVPLIWPVAILNSRGVARLILRPWRKTKAYGFRLIGLAAVLGAVFDFAFEPFATRVKHYWFWEPTALPLTWMGAPLVDFLSWALVTVLLLAFVTPLLINKKPHSKTAPDFFPLGIWLGGLLLFGTACAVQKIWPVVVADAVIGLVAALFAIRGAKW